MSEVLYRKYRPQNFAEVLGQDEVVTTLKQAISQNKIGHSYIFAGGRGTGKTTVARIFAKDLGASSDDIYELDAASNRGIDEIRNLREAVNVLPLRSPYKVYILDEAHMLTKDAANALLKTLEEPPAHCIFILATTELDKILDTVISRCEVYQFKKPNLQTLTNQIESILKREGRKISTASAELIAIAGDGSFRNALSILQKVLSTTEDKQIDDDLVRKILGVPNRQLVYQFIDGLGEKDLEKTLSAISQTKSQGFSISVYLDLILELTRKILLTRFAKNLHPMIKTEVGEDEFQYILAKASDAKAGINSAILSDLLRVRQQVELASVAELPLELFAIDSLTKKTN